MKMTMRDLTGGVTRGVSLKLAVLSLCLASVIAMNAAGAGRERSQSDPRSEPDAETQRLHSWIQNNSREPDANSREPDANSREPDANSRATTNDHRLADAVRNANRWQAQPVAGDLARAQAQVRNAAGQDPITKRFNGYKLGDAWQYQGNAGQYQGNEELETPAETKDMTIAGVTGGLVSVAGIIMTLHEFWPQSGTGQFGQGVFGNVTFLALLLGSVLLFSFLGYCAMFKTGGLPVYKFAFTLSLGLVTSSAVTTFTIKTVGDMANSPGVDHTGAFICLGVAGVIGLVCFLGSLFYACKHRSAVCGKRCM